MKRHLPAAVVLATLAAIGVTMGLARKTRPAPAPPPRPLPAAVARELDALRAARQARPDLPAGGIGDAAYAKGLDRLRAAPPEDLRALEGRLLDRAEPVLLRIDLLHVVAGAAADFARPLCGRLAADVDEPPALRLAAVSLLGAFRDPPAFDLLRGLWTSPRPFEGRSLLLAALAETGQPGAIPVLREALGAGALDIRCQAALSLGAFAQDVAVREDLIRVLGSDAPTPVRENALRALARSTAAEVDRLLREPPADLRALAEALRRERGR